MMCAFDLFSIINLIFKLMADNCSTHIRPLSKNKPYLTLRLHISYYSQLSAMEIRRKVLIHTDILCRLYDESNSFYANGIVLMCMINGITILKLVR